MQAQQLNCNLFPSSNKVLGGTNQDDDSINSPTGSLLQKTQWCGLPIGNWSSISIDATGNHLKIVVEIQAKLLWNDFIKGCIPTHWHLAQECYRFELQADKAFDRKKWTIKLIKVTWTIFMDVQNARNAHLHTKWESATNNVPDKQVKKAFALKHLMFQSDYLLFQTTFLDSCVLAPLPSLPILAPPTDIHLIQFQINSSDTFVEYQYYSQ
eukprot:6009387-Ditylum_brightwellii.AAC.1